MKTELLRMYNENLIKAVKADLDGLNRSADFYFGCASGMLTAAYAMHDALGTETVAKMSRANELAYDIVAGDVESIEESIWILENNMA